MDLGRIHKPDESGRTTLNGDSPPGTLSVRLWRLSTAPTAGGEPAMQIMLCGGGDLASQGVAALPRIR